MKTIEEKQEHIDKLKDGDGIIDLSDLDLSGAILHRTDLSLAYLYRTNLEGLSGGELKSIINQNKDTYNDIKGEFE